MIENTIAIYSFLVVASKLALKIYTYNIPTFQGKFIKGSERTLTCATLES